MAADLDTLRATYHEVLRMLDEHARGQRNWATPLWTVLMYDAFATQLASVKPFDVRTDVSVAGQASPA